MHNSLCCRAVQTGMEASRLLQLLRRRTIQSTIGNIVKRAVVMIQQQRVLPRALLVPIPVERHQGHVGLEPLVHFSLLQACSSAWGRAAKRWVQP
jgi:hypothetical protein